MSKKTCILTFKNEKLSKKVDFRKFLDPIWDLALKMVSKFVIPKFRDTLLVTKITKCGNLLYPAINIGNPYSLSLSCRAGLIKIS